MAPPPRRGGRGGGGKVIFGVFFPGATDPRASAGHLRLRGAWTGARSHSARCGRWRSTAATDCWLLGAWDEEREPSAISASTGSARRRGRGSRSRTSPARSSRGYLAHHRALREAVERDGAPREPRARAGLRGTARSFPSLRRSSRFFRLACRSTSYYTVRHRTNGARSCPSTAAAFLALSRAEPPILAADLASARIARAAAPSRNALGPRPWFAAGTGETEMRRRALSWAVLAPSPHNRQPWRPSARTGERRESTPYCGLRASLAPYRPVRPAGDEIGLRGPFLETLVLAAGRKQGHCAEGRARSPGRARPPVLDAPRPVARCATVPGRRPPPIPCSQRFSTGVEQGAPYATAIAAHSL